jgi:hypothetical protein
MRGRCTASAAMIDAGSFSPHASGTFGLRVGGRYIAPPVLVCFSVDQGTLALFLVMVTISLVPWWEIRLEMGLLQLSNHQCSLCIGGLVSTPVSVSGCQWMAARRACSWPLHCSKRCWWCVRTN